MPRAEVRRHDQNRIAEIDGISKAVGQLPIFKDLEQDIVHIRMRFFDFIQQE